MLRDCLTDYLSMRRALGYKLARDQKLLTQFLDYLDGIGTQQVTIKHALAWAQQPAGERLSWWACRLSVVRGFAAYLHTLDAIHEVPPKDLLPPPPHRATPYLYSDQDIASLLRAAGSLGVPLRAATYQTLLGLLAATGMRVGEAIRLDRHDIDLDQGIATVRDSKFGKSRELPLHSSTRQVLGAYLRRRDRLHLGSSSPALFISPAGTRLLYCNVNWTFLRLVDKSGLRPRSASCRPRLHDLRHSFAVRTVLDWYRAGVDVQVHLPLLSTYLGHVNPAATYWYLSAAPELLALAAQRLALALKARP
jgi:integrase